MQLKILTEVEKLLTNLHLKLQSKMMGVKICWQDEGPIEDALLFRLRFGVSDCVAIPALEANCFG